MELQVFRLMDQYLQALAHSALLLTHLFSPFASRQDVLNALRLSFVQEHRLLQFLSKSALNSQTKRLGSRFLNRVYETCQKQRNFFKARKMNCELYFKQIYELINQAIQFSTPFSVLLPLVQLRIANYNLHLRPLFQNQPPLSLQTDKQKQSAKTKATLETTESQEMEPCSLKYGILDLKQNALPINYSNQNRSEQFKRLLALTVERNRAQSLTINKFRKSYQKSYSKRLLESTAKPVSQTASPGKLYSKSTFFERASRSLKEANKQTKVYKTSCRVNKKFRTIRQLSLNQIEVRLPEQGREEVAVFKAFRQGKEVLQVTGQEIQLCRTRFGYWVQREKAPASLQKQCIRLGNKFIK